MMPGKAQVLLAHPGTQYAPRLAAELERHGMLKHFVTGMAVTEDGLLGAIDRCMPAGLRRRWENRRISGVPAARLRTFPRLEWNALCQVRQGLAAEQVFFERNAAFQRVIPDAWISEASHVIGFDTSSWLLAARAQQQGRPFILDQSIGHPLAKEQVYASLRTRFSEWAETVPRKGPEDIAREQQEHTLATTVVVPSGFVRRTLIEHGVAGEKIRIIPFGTDLALFQPAKTPAPGPVAFLFTGTLTARKGVPVLLQAWQEASLHGRAELWLAGSGRVPPSATATEGVRWLGALSRPELAATMQRAHVFVCPSFFEGLAQVQVEALAAGLPVIGTTASGADEIVVPGETGFVLEPGDVAALVAELQRLAGDSDLRSAMRARCIQRREALGWLPYGLRWRDLLGGYRQDHDRAGRHVVESIAR